MPIIAPLIPLPLAPTVSATVITLAALAVIVFTRARVTSAEPRATRMPSQARSVRPRSTAHGRTGSSGAAAGFTVHGVSSQPTPPNARNVKVSAHAAEQYQQRVKPALEPGAARAELEQLVTVAQITTSEPAWLHAAKPAPFYLVISAALALPLAPQNGGWIATTCVTAGTYTPVRRAQRTAYKSSRAAAKRARRRTRF